MKQLISQKGRDRSPNILLFHFESPITFFHILICIFVLQVIQWVCLNTSPIVGPWSLQFSLSFPRCDLLRSPLSTLCELPAHWLQYVLPMSGSVTILLWIPHNWIPYSYLLFLASSFHKRARIWSQVGRSMMSLL